MTLEITKANYHSMEADQETMCYSQFKDFYYECEAMAMAKIYGGWEEPNTPEKLAGSYVHAWNEGALDEFRTEHPELYSSQGPTKGQLKSTFRDVEYMIETLKNDPVVMHTLDGDKEVIMMAEWAGCLWRIKPDVFRKDAWRIVDLKTTASIRERIWIPHDRAYGTFLDAFAYFGQLASYAKVASLFMNSEELPETYVVAVSKEDPPDKDVILVDADRLYYELERIEFAMPHILDVKYRRTEPKRCGKCRYCRETKKISRIIHYSELLN